MNYTKGKWKVGHYIVYADTPSMEFPSLICNTDIGIVSESEKTANAHLIASAPAMYEALKEIGLSIAVNYENDNTPYFRIDKEYLDRTRAIVAKAEGK